MSVHLPPDPVALDEVPLDALPPEATPASRRTELDLARGVAVLGMAAVDFKYALGVEEASPGWLGVVADSMDGRFAALFVTVTGWAVAELVRRTGRREAERVVLRRALGLGVVGVLLSLVWPVDILHMYPGFVILALMATAWSQRTRFAAMIGLGLGYVALLVGLGAERIWMDQVDPAVSAMGVVRHVLYAGGHPLVPWGAFAILGVWLGGLDLSAPATGRRVAVGAAGVLFAVELVDGVLGASGGGLRAVLFDHHPSPPVPGFLLRAAPLAVLGLLLARWLMDGVPATWARALAATGRRSLTAYLAHILVCGAVAMFVDSPGSPAQAFVLAGAFGALVTWAAVRGERAGRRGPAEALLRRASGT